MTRADRPSADGITQAVVDRFAGSDPHRPRLVWYGAEAGARTELSTASLTNWAAKTAGFLVDELGGTAGDPVLWRVRRSWQGLPLLLGCWWAGMVVTDDESAVDQVLAAFVDEGDEAAVDAADEVVLASTHPFGLAGPDLPPLCRSVADAILPQADRFVPRSGRGLGDPATVTAGGTLTAGEVLELAAAAGTAAGHEAVLLSVVPPDLPDGVCGGALAAWLAGGCLIQVDSAGTLDVDRIAADERVTATLGAALSGLPRIG